MEDWADRGRAQDVCKVDLTDTISVLEHRSDVVHASYSVGTIAQIDEM